MRVGLLLFLTRLIACPSLKRAFHQARPPWRIPASPLQTWCGGCGRHRTELGFDNPSLTMRTGLAGRSLTCLPQIPALSACSCPLWLSLARSAVVLEVTLLSTSLTSGKNFLCTDTAHIAHPHAQICQGHFTDGHHLIFAVIQFIHLPFLLCQIFNGSQ